LSITKTDNATDYVAGSSTTYTIVVTNNGPNDVIGATVTDNITIKLDSWTWTCIQTNGANGCDGVVGSTSDFTDVVNLPSLSSITYTATANIAAGATGVLSNAASISVPVGITDPNTSNNTAADTPPDQLITTDPPGNIGPTPDGSVRVINSPSVLTLQLSSALIVNSSNSDGPDLVYYEFAEGTNPGVLMDKVILQISDGRNWYTILDWGDTLTAGPDSNSNIPVPLGAPNPTTCVGEPDNCEIDASFLYNSGSFSTGIAINVDGIGIPAGTYPYIRILSPADSGDGVDVDAIQVLP
jgi:uncharacterized repeat protein (TIGR01451 family)